MAVLRMSTEALSRVETLVQVVSGRLPVTEAAQLMGLTRRHAHRLLLRLTDDRPSAPLPPRRSRPTTQPIPDAVPPQNLSPARHPSPASRPSFPIALSYSQQ